MRTRVSEVDSAAPDEHSPCTALVSVIAFTNGRKKRCMYFAEVFTVEGRVMYVFEWFRVGRLCRTFN